MIVSRRSFLGACAAIPAISALEAKALVAFHPAARSGLGEVWGLRFWGEGAAPAVAVRKRRRSTPPAWHPEFS